MLKLNTWRLLFIFVSNSLNRAIISREATENPQRQISLTVAYVSHTHSHAESHTYRTHVVHGSHTDRTTILPVME